MDSYKRLTPNPNPANTFNTTDKKDDQYYQNEEGFVNYGEFKIGNNARIFKTIINNKKNSANTEKGITNGKIQLETGSSIEYTNAELGSIFNNFESALFLAEGEAYLKRLTNKGMIKSQSFLSAFQGGYNYRQGIITIESGEFTATDFTNDGVIIGSENTEISLGDKFTNNGLLDAPSVTRADYYELTNIINNGNFNVSKLTGLDVENKRGSQLRLSNGQLDLINELEATTEIITNEENSNPVYLHSLDNLGTFNLIEESCVATLAGDGKFINQKNGNTGDMGRINISNTSTLEILAESKLINNGLIFSDGTIKNLGIIDNSQGKIFSKIDNEGKGKVIDPKLTGTGKIIGDFENNGIIAPGNSAGGHMIDGSLIHNDNGSKEIELGGWLDANRNREETEYDFIDITGDLIINGGSLDVSVIDNFKLRRGMQFMISQVEGEVVGTYEGLQEGASTGQFEGFLGNKLDLYITYKGGDGNDISLYTEPINPFLPFWI